MNRITLLLLLLFMLLGASEEKFKYATYIGGNGVKIPYRIMYPDGYNPNKIYPLVIYLHGVGSRGADNKRQISRAGLSTFLYKQFDQNYPSIVLIPQCNSDVYWTSSLSRGDNRWEIDTNKIDEASTMKSLMELITIWKSSANIDSANIIVGGISMGGIAVYELLWRMPNTFSGAFPLCGATNVDNLQASSFVDNAFIWLIHGSQDITIDCSHSRDAFMALKNIEESKKLNIRFTEYAWGHNIDEKIFEIIRFGTWLFKESSLTHNSNYTIISKSSKMALTNNTNNTLSLNIYTNNKEQSFAIQEHGVKSYTIKTDNGRYLSVSGQSLTTAMTCTAAAQHWRVKEISKGIFRITSEVQEGFVLEAASNGVKLATGYDGSNAQLWDLNIH